MMENISAYLPYLRGYDFTGKVPVVIDFYASWCGPCKSLSPMVEQMAKIYEGRVKILKVNVEKNTSLASVARIQSVPTLFFVDIDGNIRRRVGVPMHGELVEAIEGLIKM